MKLRSAIGFFVCLLLSPVLSAQIPHIVKSGTTDSWAWQNGNDLFSNCDPGPKAPEYARCLTYIQGAVDMIGSLQGAIGSDNKEFWKLTAVCMPDEATTGQIADVVLKYMKENPEQRADKAGWIIIRALIRAWGCPAVK